MRSDSKKANEKQKVGARQSPNRDYLSDIMTGVSEECEAADAPE